jgi:aerobic-type carbon monoxide dehydrogenase small subunit (CoxS/CutS family)
VERPTEEVTVDLTVNGRPVSATVQARVLLSDYLRSHAVKSVHLGCEQGVCGACTVLVSGVPVRSCLMLAVEAVGEAIQTVEGLEGTPAFEAVAASLTEHRALQCGFCTPGIAVSLTAMVASSDSDEDSMMDQLSGHICRCTGYRDIVLAARGALKSS